MSSVVCMMRSSRGDYMLPTVAEISVLVVDDHAVFADAVAARLSRESDLRPVRVAYSVLQARAELARYQPDVAVLDLFLGDGSGLERTTPALGRPSKAPSPRPKPLHLTKRLRWI